MAATSRAPTAARRRPSSAPCRCARRWPSPPPSVAIGFYHPPFAYLFSWAPAAEKLILHDLVYDSVVAAAVLMSAFSLLSSTHPATIAAVTAGTSILFHYIRQAEEERGNRLRHGPCRVDHALHRHCHRRSPLLPHPLGQWPCQCCLLPRPGLDNTAVLDAPATSASSAFCSCACCPAVRPPTVSGIIDAGQSDSKQWVQEAKHSESLSEAVAQYRTRYGAPPPPNFDKWYSFAVEQNSPVIDLFDQIHDDLLPFWGVPPALLRERTTHLLEQTRLGIGGFRIKDHKVELSPHTPGTQLLDDGGLPRHD